MLAYRGRPTARVMRSIAAQVAGALRAVVACAALVGCASRAPLAVVACAVLAACATHPPLAVVPPESSSTTSPVSGTGNGDLVVYSATFAPTLEEGEYPAHTDYTIATVSDRIIEHVTNQTGSFDKRPATVSLASGAYHVRAQYDRGGFVTIPVVIEVGKITTLDLDGAAMPRGTSAPPQPIRLPDGKVVGWRSVISR
jgi:hypothetical protein